LHCFGDGLGIDVVALVGLHIGLDVLGRHQPHFVPLLAQSPPEEVSATAGFHADHLHLHIRGEGQYLPAGTALADHHVAVAVQAYEMKYVLG
jgi:hypothetical protein